MAEPKQVILARKDLNMSPGKLAAQVAHASLGAITDKLEWSTVVPKIKRGEITVLVDGVLDKWLTGRFTKIVLGVNSQEELLGLYETAVKDGLICKLILDAGLTEFNNIPTYTCVAIGPADQEDLNKLTGHLKLY